MSAVNAGGGMSLRRLLKGLVDHAAVPDVLISGIVHDSRIAKPGDLFCALAGTRAHGMAHATEAVAAGVAAILYDPDKGGKELAWGMETIPCLPIVFLDQRLGLLAARFYGEPSHRLDVYAITGTNGKTSCSHFLAQALSTPQYPAAVIGTLGWGIPGELHATRHTTPDAIEVHALLARLEKQGIRCVTLEASSHGLVQGRLNGVRIRGGLFTNLGRDHLDYHGTLEAYLAAKLRLVEWPGLEFLAFNLDDPNAATIAARIPSGVRPIGFSRSLTPQRFGADITMVRAEAVRHEPGGLAFSACAEGRAADVRVPIFGEYNVENLLATLAMLLGCGLSLDESVRRLGCVRPVPGRMECFTAAEGPTVVVDYAHTPDALEKVLAGLSHYVRGRLWVVFGCGGERDRGKRPQMGAIAARMADHIIVTDDNPRYEDGDAIVADILAGIQGSETEVAVMRDRRLAIQAAIEQAGAGDIVLVAGKGHESHQEIAGVRYPFSDREVVQETLRGLGDRGCA